MDLKTQIKEKEEQLQKLNLELNKLKEEQQRKKEIKDNYKLNDVPDRIEYNYQELYKALKQEVKNHCGELIDGSFIEEIEKRFSINYGPKPESLYNCPKCGNSNCLYVGEYSFNSIGRKYAVTCSHCDFVGSMISDYGEAWGEFRCWLQKKGYLKNNEL